MGSKEDEEEVKEEVKDEAESVKSEDDGEMPEIIPSAPLWPILRPKKEASPEVIPRALSPTPEPEVHAPADDIGPEEDDDIMEMAACDNLVANKITEQIEAMEDGPEKAKLKKQWDYHLKGEQATALREQWLCKACKALRRWDHINHRFAECECGEGDVVKEGTESCQDTSVSSDKEGPDARAPLQPVTAEDVAALGDDQCDLSEIQKAPADLKVPENQEEFDAAMLMAGGFHKVAAKVGSPWEHQKQLWRQQERETGDRTAEQSSGAAQSSTPADASLSEPVSTGDHTAEQSSGVAQSSGSGGGSATSTVLFNASQGEASPRRRWPKLEPWKVYQNRLGGNVSSQPVVVSAKAGTVAEDSAASSGELEPWLDCEGKVHQRPRFGQSKPVEPVLPWQLRWQKFCSDHSSERSIAQALGLAPRTVAESLVTNVMAKVPGLVEAAAEDAPAGSSATSTTCPAAVSWNREKEPDDEFAARVERALDAPRDPPSKGPSIYERYQPPDRPPGAQYDPTNTEIKVDYQIHWQDAILMSKANKWMWHEVVHRNIYADCEGIDVNVQHVLFALRSVQVSPDLIESISELESPLLTPGKWFHVGITNQAIVSMMSDGPLTQNRGANLKAAYHGSSMDTLPFVLACGLKQGPYCCSGYPGIYVEGQQRRDRIYHYMTHVPIRGLNPMWMWAIMYECLVDRNRGRTCNHQWVQAPGSVHVVGVNVHVFNLFSAYDKPCAGWLKVHGPTLKIGLKRCHSPEHLEDAMFYKTAEVDGETGGDDLE